LQTVVSTSSSLNNLLHMFSWALTSLFCRTLQSKEVKRDILKKKLEKWLDKKFYFAASEISCSLHKILLLQFCIGIWFQMDLNAVELEMRLIFKKSIITLFSLSTFCLFTRTCSHPITISVQSMYSTFNNHSGGFHYKHIPASTLYFYLSIIPLLIA